MSEIVKKVAPGSSYSQVKPMHVFIIGKVKHIRHHGQFTYTIVVCPSQNSYRSSETVELRSKSPFAQREEEVNIWGCLGGRQGKSFSFVDRNTGEMKSAVPVNLFLDLVE